MFYFGIQPATFGVTVVFSIFAITNKWDVEMTGSVAGYPVIVVLTFASRNSLATFLFGIPFERALFWHKLIGGLVVVVLTWVHGYRAIVGGEPGGGGGGGDGDDDEAAAFHGLMLGALFSAFPVFSPWLLRRHLFNLFYAIHILLVVAAAVVSVIHGFGTIFVGLGVWGFDVCFRYLYLCLVTAPKTCTATRLPANVIRLTFHRASNLLFKYSAGQYVFIMVPGVNIFEWHPFSLSSAPHQELVSVHIRVLGNWTRSLYDLIGAKGGGPLEIPAYWEGPYGAPEIDMDGDKYKLFLLISGGIGITPMQSIANSLAYQHEEEGRPLRKIWFVWSCADKYMLGANFEHDDAWRGGDAPPKLPLSFQPDTISRRMHVDEGLFRRRRDAPHDGAVLHTELYLTRLRRAEDLDEANVRPQLQPFLRFGRPNLPEIFATFRAYAMVLQSLHESSVGVMVCGPSALVDDVRRFCGSESREGIRFDYHAEIFEF